jgi:hypothetical protein
MNVSHIVVAVVFLLVGGWIGAKWPGVNVLTKVIPAS